MLKINSCTQSLQKALRKLLAFRLKQIFLITLAYELEHYPLFLLYEHLLLHNEEFFCYHLLVDNCTKFFHLVLYGIDKKMEKLKSRFLPYICENYDYHTNIPIELIDILSKANYLNYQSFLLVLLYSKLTYKE